MTAKKWILLICSIAAILMGVLMIVFRAETLNVIVIIIAIALMIAGILYTIFYFVRKREAFTQYDLVIGLGAFVLGLFGLCRLPVVIDILPVLFGFTLCGIGFFTLQNMINLIRIKNRAWIFLLILSILAINFGLFLCLGNSKTIASIIMVLLGIALAFGGLTVLITTFILKDQIKPTGFTAVDETITSWTEDDNQ